MRTMLILFAFLAVTKFAHADVEIIEVPRTVPAPKHVEPPQTQFAVPQQPLMIDTMAEVVNVFVRVQNMNVVGYDVTVRHQGAFYTIPMNHYPPVGAYVKFRTGI